MRDTRSHLSRLVDPMRIPGRRSWFIVQPYSRGDTYLTAALMEAFRAEHGHVTDDIVLITKASHAPIAAMFGAHISRTATIADAELQQLAADMRATGSRTGLLPDQAVFLHPSHMDDGRADALTNVPSFSQKNMYQQLLRLPFTRALSTPVIPTEWRTEARAFAQAHGMPAGRSVILMPDANSYPVIEDAFWEQLASGLRAQGWSVFTNLFGTNAGSRTAAFAGTTGISPSFHLLLPLAEHAGWVVSTLTGGVNILITARAACRKTVVARGPAPGTTLKFNDLIELDCAFPYAFQKTFDGEVYDIEELEVRGPQDFAAVARQVCEGRNSRAAHPPPAEPVLQVTADTTPGDVLDRITILEIKEELLSGPGVLHNVRRELLMLRTGIAPKLQARRAELNGLVSDLKAVNRAAWDTNELIFKGFADGFGQSTWTLDRTDPASVERSQTMVRTFRESQRLNRERVNLKTAINRLLSSHTIEEKSYDDPTRPQAPQGSSGPSSPPIAAPASMPGASPAAIKASASASADEHLAQAGLHAIQFDLMPSQRDTAAKAIAAEVNRRVPALAGRADAAALQALQTDSVLRLGQIMSAAQAAEVVAYFAALPCYSAHVAAYSDGQARPPEHAARLGPYGSYPLAQTLQAPYLFELAMNPTVLALAQAYLGCVPTLYSVHVWWTFAGEHAPGRTHGYHRDQDDHRFLSLFTYLTDVGPQDGPIDLLRGTHRLDVVEAAVAEHRRTHPEAAPTDARDFFPPWAGNGYDDTPGKVPRPYEELFAGLKTTLQGAAGAGFVSDTFALHRGNPPTRQHRLACWMRYGISKNRVCVIDGLEPVAGSTLRHRPPRTPQTDWITRLIVDPDR